MNYVIILCQLNRSSSVGLRLFIVDDYGHQTGKTQRCSGKSFILRYHSGICMEGLRINGVLIKSETGYSRIKVRCVATGHSFES